MTGTVKQFKDTLEEMKSIYPFDDEKTYIQTRDIVNLGHDHLSLATTDEKTGILIEMSKKVTRDNEGGNV